MSSGLTFRRIHGRIVPIRAKADFSAAQRTEKLKTGALALAAGVGVAAGAAIGAAALVKHSAGLAIRSKDLFRAGMGIGMEGGGRIASLTRKAAEVRHTSALVFKARNPVLAAGAFASAPLLGMGFQKVNEGATGKKSTVAGDYVAHAAGIAAVGGASLIYYKGLGGTFANAFIRAVNKVKGTPIKKIMPIKTKYGVFVAPKKIL